MENIIFNPQNCEDLKQVSNAIASLMKENDKGFFADGQLIYLGELLKHFGSNPIVANSGILNYSQSPQK
jgi:hypothetical protein